MIQYKIIIIWAGYLEELLQRYQYINNEIEIRSSRDLATWKYCVMGYHQDLKNVN